MNKREIKFRVWDGWIMWYPETKTVDNKTTNIVFFNRENSIGWGLYEDDFDRRIVSGEHHKIMQYTGLKDKNNKEIYEGDIVRDSEIQWEVRFGSFYLDDADLVGFYVWNDKYGEGAIGKPDESVIEVIDNIYETPQLIESQTEK